MKGFVEKRKFRRISIEGTAEVAWNGQSYTGTVSDLSLLGAMVKLSASISPGEPVKVSLHIGSGHHVIVHVEGIVARTVPDGIGIRFTTIDVVSLSRLKNIFEFNTLSIENMIEDYLMTFELPRPISAQLNQRETP